MHSHFLNQPNSISYSNHHTDKETTRYFSLKQKPTLQVGLHFKESSLLHSRDERTVKFFSPSTVFIR